MWKISNLKAMADTLSDIYRKAIDKDLPDGLVRGLKDNLKEFKQQWRDIY